MVANAAATPPKPPHLHTVPHHTHTGVELVEYFAMNVRLGDRISNRDNLRLTS